MSKGPAASDDQDASPEITVRAPVVGTAVTLLSNATALDGDTGSLALGRDSIPPPAMINTPAGWPERFTLGRVLGAGATSLVLAAKDEELHRDVAIKLLRTELVHDAEARARFEREAGLTGNLEHPNIAPVYDIGKSEGLAYLVMRQVRGRPLGGMIRRARDHGLTEVLPINDLINIFLKVCDAVSYAHDHGLLHRDIKPDNILVGDHGEVVLVDWGAASTSNDADPAGTIVGTPHYMAPERVTGQPASVATDVFALGASMFYAFVLRRPLEGLHGEEFWRERLAGTMLPLTSAEQKRVPRQLLSIILKALHSSADQRHTSVLSLAGELKDYQAGRAAWLAPMLTERFADDGWRSRWLESEPGQFEVQDGCLVSQSPRQSLVFFRQRLAAGVAVEFEGRILPGTRPGDLSVVWSENDVLAGDGLGLYNGTGRSYLLQLGAFSNVMACIRQLPGGHAVAAAPVQLETGRWYTIRAEIEERTLRLLLDGNLICEHEEDFPFSSGFVALYGFYQGKAFRNVRISSKGVPERVSAIMLGDVFYRSNDFAEASREYRRVAEAHAGGSLGAEATYKQGLCLYHQSKREEAFAVWATLSDDLYKNLAELHVVDEQVERGEIAAALDHLADLYAREPQLRPAVRRRWADYLRRQLMTCPIAVAPYIDFHDRLFPDDSGTAPTVTSALHSLGRWQEMVDRYPDQRLEYGAALIHLGRTREVVENFGDAPFIEDEARLRMGLIDLEPGRDLYNAVPMLKGQYKEALELQPNNVEVLLALGELEYVLEIKDVWRNERAMALRLLGRLDEALATGDFHSLLYADRIGEALERARTLEELNLIWSYRAFRAYEQGDREQYRESRAKLATLPFSFRWHNVWFTRFVVFPFLDQLDGDEGALLRSCQVVIRDWKEVFIQRLWYFARFVAGEIEVEEYRAQPVQMYMAARVELAYAIRCEANAEQKSALEHYRRFLALPAHERTLEQGNTDPVLDRFVRWRIAELERRSRGQQRD